MSLNKRKALKLPLCMLLAVTFTGFACNDDPVRPGNGGEEEPESVTWEMITTFESGGRIGAVCGTGPGDVFCSYLGLIRMSDGWTVIPQGAVVRYDGADWSAPVLYIRATTYDLDMWAAGVDDVYLAEGRLVHFNGSYWRPTGIPANTVYGTGPSDIYAASAADNNAVYYYDGSRWKLLKNLEGDNDIETIWATNGPFLVVARRHSVAMWNGASWNEVQFDSHDFIEDVWGTAANNVYVVGKRYGSGGRIWHYTVSGWQEVPIPSVSDLNAIWGSALNNVYAVGVRGTIIHFNGTLWEEVEPLTSKHLWDVWGSGPDDVYVVGDDGKALHFNGATWSSIRKNKPDEKVNCIWAESMSRFAVASWLDPGTVYFYDHGQWTESLVLKTRRTVRNLAGVTLNDLYALIDREVYHFDGDIWSFAGDLDADFPGEMWFPESNVGFAIGGGSIFHFDNNTWNEVVSGAPWGMRGMWGVSKSLVYVINSTGLAYRYDGLSWQTILSPTSSKLLDICGVSGTEVYVLAEDGFYMYNGDSWLPRTAPARPYLTDLVLNAADNMFAWGGCWLEHFDGATWNASCPPDPARKIIKARDNSIMILRSLSVDYQVEEN